MEIGERIWLDDGDITGEVMEKEDAQYAIKWSSSDELFWYSNDVDWNEVTMNG